MKIQNQLGYIKGITFAPFHKRGSLSTLFLHRLPVTVLII